MCLVSGYKVVLGRARRVDFGCMKLQVYAFSCQLTVGIDLPSARMRSEGTVVGSVCVSVCYSTSYFFNVRSSHKRYDLLHRQ